MKDSFRLYCNLKNDFKNIEVINYGQKCIVAYIAEQGEDLPISSIIDRFGTSRTVLLTALNELVSYGYLSSYMDKGRKMYKLTTPNPLKNETRPNK